jgi:endonuclease/exonuclease/phosphatase family metal-dependent hydrolase
MFATFSSWVHGLRRNLSRSEWAVRHLQLPVSEGTAEEPGLLLIQIDGFARAELERAMTEGRMPFLKDLRDESRYELTTFYPGLPSSTPAVQAELFYGVRTGVPAFSFQNRATGEIVSMFDPELAGEFEKLFSSRGEGLLQGGSSWSNIYSGGADAEECHFCISSLGMESLFRRGRRRSRLAFVFLHLPSFIRITGLVLLELILGLGDAFWGFCRGQRLSLELGAVLSRMGVGIALRELLRIGGKIDLVRGLPIVHVNFLGYDEMSHRRGPGSWFAHWTLPGIDRAISQLYRAAHRSRRRDYQVWIFSDHGQDRVQSFETSFPGGIRRIVAECLSSKDISPTPARPARPFSRRLYEREKRRRAAQAGNEEEFSLATMGPVGHVYLRNPQDDQQKHNLARRLVMQGRIPAVAYLCSDGRVVWHDTRGEALAPEQVQDRLKGYPESLRREMAADLAALCRNENAGDLVLFGFSGAGECWTFAPERGAHAGLGPQETHGFLLTPPATPLPLGNRDFIRPEALRAAVFHALGRQPLEVRATSAGPVRHLRVMTYNVHGCAGMDGRVSPRRIARIIARQNPDIVALQEIDHGRSRSRGEDQANLIADLLGYHVVFCPTVISGGEQYGHAILSRHPLETVKVAGLPFHPRGIWPERRCALWTRLQLHDSSIHVLTTHLGLGSAERQEQMKALLGPEWLGPVLETEPVILCGDLNCRPGGATHRLAAAKLRDVAHARGAHTFSSLRPLVRLDHIFVSRHFSAKSVAVIRNHLTRVGSDHLPLQADLLVQEAPAETLEKVTTGHPQMH